MTTKDKGHWASHSEAKHDEVREAAVSALDWLLARRKQALIATGSVLAALLLLAGVMVQRRAAHSDAWDRYALAELMAYGGRPTDAADAARKLGEERPGTRAATMARLLQGDILQARGDYKGALEAYAKAAEEQGPLGPFAAADKAMTQEAAGQCAEAVATAKQFVSESSEHFLAPLVISVQARCEQALGQADAARVSLQKLTLQYPDSPWSAWANARLSPSTK
jgi:tetratricopeptide (TPR) repeat protein